MDRINADRLMIWIRVATVVTVLLAVTSCSREMPTVWESMQGAWQVSQTSDMTSSYVEQLGVLEIDGTSYSFLPASSSKDVSEVDQRLQFLFDVPEGEVRIEYVDGVHGSEEARLFDSYDTLAICTFGTNSTAPSFLVMVGEDDSLFLHSLRSEVSLWSISKNF